MAAASRPSCCAAGHGPAGVLLHPLARAAAEPSRSRAAERAARALLTLPGGARS